MFKKSGLVPLNRHEVLNQLPRQQIALNKDDSIASINETTALLEENRKSLSQRKKNKRGPKVPAGVLVDALDDRLISGSSSNDNLVAIISGTCGTSTDILNNICHLCGEDEDDSDDVVINWKDCDKCYKWYHLTCLENYYGLSIISQSVLCKFCNPITSICHVCYQEDDEEDNVWVQCIACDRCNHLHCLENLSGEGSVPVLDFLCRVCKL